MFIFIVGFVRFGKYSKLCKTGSIVLWLDKLLPNTILLIG